MVGYHSAGKVILGRERYPELAKWEQEAGGVGDRLVVPTSGATLHAWRHGPESGQLVVFIHGGWMDHRMFDEQVESVVNAGFQTLTSDLRGHGESLADAKYDTSVTDMALDQLALLDSLGHNGPVHLVGQSLGGMVAQHVVLLAPERVRSLVTIGAPCVTPESRRIAATMATVWGVSGGITGLMPEAAIRRQLPAGTAVKPHVQEYVRRATENLTKRDFRWLVRVSRQAGRRLPGYRVECPVLILRGEHDASGAGKLTALTGVRWARRDPHARYEVLPGAGHQAHQDQPEAFNQILLDFLAR